MQIVQVFSLFLPRKATKLERNSRNSIALAVSQAGNFICCDSSLSNYRKLYQRERDNLRRFKDDATWKVSDDKSDGVDEMFPAIMLNHATSQRS